MPGVPDIYQGTELWDNSLVDPDNRRPVDFALRRGAAGRLDAGRLPPVDETGAAKLLVVSRALRLRRDRPELFTGYQPVAVTGRPPSTLVAFDRGGAVAVATRLPVGLAGRRLGRHHAASCPTARGGDVFTGERVVSDIGGCRRRPARRSRWPCYPRLGAAVTRSRHDMTG